MRLTRDSVVPRDALGSRYGTERVEVDLNPKFLVLPSFTGGRQVGHHNLLLLPMSQEEVANLRFLRGKLVEVANLLHREVNLEQFPPQDMHPCHDLVGVRI